MKHAKVTRTTSNPDGSTKIEHESYYAQLSHIKVETEKQLHTSNETIIKDFISAMRHITDEGSTELSLTITAKDNKPLKIKKRWTVNKQNFNRK